MILDAQTFYRTYLLISHSLIMTCSCITQTGCTALYSAAANGHLEIVKLLLQAGAKVLPNNVQRFSKMLAPFQKVIIHYTGSSKSFEGGQSGKSSRNCTHVTTPQKITALYQYIYILVSLLCLPVICFCT